jgi:transposase
MVARKKRKEYTLDERLTMVKLSEEGLSNRRIARKLKKSRRGVDKVLKRWKKTGSLLPKPRPGAPIIFNDTMMREVGLAMKREKFVFMSDVITFIKDNYGIELSPRCVRRHLRKTGFYPYAPLKKPLVNANQRKERLRLVRKWVRDEVDWESVIFTDETGIDRVRGAHKGKVWLPAGSADSPLRVQPTAKFGGGRQNLWAAISHQGVLAYTVYEGDLTAKAYISIVKKHLLGNAAHLFAEDHWYLMQDGDPAHTAHLTIETLESLGDSRGFSLLDWPASSPDLNPIENFWAALKEWLARRGIAPSLDVLTTWIDEAMAYFNSPAKEEYFQKLFNSMPDRLQAVRDHKGGMTKY